MPRVIDCFLFYDEVDVLKIRLNELDPYVDEFVLVECGYTFRGQNRVPLYDWGVNTPENSEAPEGVTHRAARGIRMLIKQFGHKITHVVAPSFPEVYLADNSKLRADEWEPEFTARNAMMAALRYCNDNDIIIISDVDEIPNLKKWRALGGLAPCLFELYQHFYFLDYRAKMTSRFPFCPAPVAVEFFELKALDSVQKLRRNKGGLPRIHLGGWHFTYQGGVDKIIAKIEAFSHFEYDKENWKDRDRIEKCIAQGLDPFEREGLQDFESVPIDNTFPEYLQKHHELFQHMLCKDPLRVKVEDPVLSKV